MPKLLVLATRFPLPSETFVAAHLRAMQRHGWEVHLCADEIDRQAWERLRTTDDLFVQVHELAEATERWRAMKGLRRGFAWRRCLGGRVVSRLKKMEGKRQRARACAFAELSANIRPDVIHAHFGPNGVTASFAAERLGVPLFVDFHGFDLTEIPFRQGWDAYQQNLSRARGVVHSVFAAGLLREHLKIPVECVRFGIDAGRFAAAARPKTWPTPLRLLLVGRLVPYKGQETALRALALLESATLALAGDGPDEPMLRALAEELGLSERVRFLGAIAHAEVARCMAEADLLLLPSRLGPENQQEAFGLAALEAQASGLPVIATRIGGLPETVGEGGWIVPPDDPKTLADAIRAVLETETPQSAQKRALHWAARFRLDEMEAAYDRLARQILERSPQE